MSTRAEVPEAVRRAMQKACIALLAAGETQTSLGRRLGYTQAAIGKLKVNAEAGLAMKNALLKDMGISELELMRQYGAEGYMPTPDDAEEWVGRETSLLLAKKRGRLKSEAGREAARILRTSPLFNRPEWKNRPARVWSDQFEKLFAALTPAMPPPPPPHPPRRKSHAEDLGEEMREPVQRRKAG